MRILSLVLLLSSAALGAPGRIGLYPLQLPGGQEELAQRLAVQLHEGAATLPGVQAFDLVAHSACAPDEGGCLAQAARRAGLEAMIGAELHATPRGYSYRLRVFDLKGVEQGSAEGDVQGGPLDLAAALEHGVCEALGAAPCLGTLKLQSGDDAAGAHLWLDGQDQGALPLGKALSLPVGRHVVKLGDDERRVRVSYGREARLSAGLRGGQLALLDAASPGGVLAVALAEATPRSALAIAPPAALSAAAAPRALQPERDRAVRVLFAGGAALLAAAAGVGLYSHLEANALDARYRSGALTDADAGRYRTLHTATIAATALAATGAGAVLSGALIFSLGPTGLSGRF